MSDFIRIVEVGPRDGLQNESIPVPIELKLEFIQALVGAGLQDIEATSFVSPKWVPQLADSMELWPQLPLGARFSALVPNLKGLQSALSVGCNRIALFTAASEEFTKANINMTIEESLAGFADLVALLRESVSDSWVRGYVSTAFECPYAGRIEPSKVVFVALRLLGMGVDEISIGDTIGVASPSEVRALTTILRDEIPIEKLAYHFHDTRGTAIANVACALEFGIRTFDSSAAGLGGCPYAKEAGGNLATEDLAYFLTREGLTHSVDLAKLALASLPVLEHLGKGPQAKAQVAVLAESRQK
jgi:isopropylmalate/homocitrate/citramalate synthase